MRFVGRTATIVSCMAACYAAASGRLEIMTAFILLTLAAIVWTPGDLQ